MDECQRRREAEERAQEVWLYWLALAPSSKTPLIEVTQTGAGALVTSALSEHMAKRLFKARLGFDVDVLCLSLHGELMFSPNPRPEDDQ